MCKEKLSGSYSPASDWGGGANFRAAAHPLLTVFTPSYNRAHTLPRLYRSLCAQKNKCFEWVIVDDGSTDDTAALVQSWSTDSPFPIRYKRQANLGMVAAHNTAFDMASGEILVCIDSDDFLTDDAVSIIADAYAKIREDQTLAGIVGLDVSMDGSVIGDSFPPSISTATFAEIRFQHKIRGDKKYVFRRSAINEVGRYPSVIGEKFPAVSFLYRKIDRRYRLKVINAPLCIVDYQQDGNTSQKLKLYMRNPNAFMLFRELTMDEPFDAKEKIVSAIHYVASAVFARKLAPAINGRHGGLALMVLPLGLMLYFYILVITRWRR